jgi:hypothetical protein
MTEHMLSVGKAIGCDGATEKEREEKKCQCDAIVEQDVGEERTWRQTR